MPISFAQRLIQPIAVPMFPCLSPRDLRPGGPAEQRASFPFTSQRIVYTLTGSTAIYQAARQLRLEPGTGVLCPAYNCGHEIEPLLRAGLLPKYYGLGVGLQADLAQIESQIDERTRAVLLTHYFGFPQPVEQVAALCKRHGLLLIEDCAHALFSCLEDRALGTFGDAAIFSLRKTLALPNGGALIVHGGDVSPDRLVAPPPFVGWSKIIDLTHEGLRVQLDQGHRYRAWLSLAALSGLWLTRAAWRRLLKRHPSATYDPDDESFSAPQHVFDWRMSALSKHIIDNSRPRQVVDRRRQNYRRVAAALRGRPALELLFPELPAGVCPWMLPVRCADAPLWVERLQAVGVEAMQVWSIRHPAVPWRRFPQEAALKREVFALPIHQDLQERQIEQMITALDAGDVVASGSQV